MAKGFSILLLLALPGVVQAQTASRPVLITARGAFFALSVADLPASRQWYTEKLGLRVMRDIPRQDQLAGGAVLEGGGLIVELLQLDDAVPPSQPAAGSRERVHGIFKVGVVIEDFDGTVAALRARNVEIAYGPYPASGGHRANVIIRDNAGNLIQLFAN